MMQGPTLCHTALESPPAYDAPRPTPWHASRAASPPHALHVRAHDKASEAQTGTAAATPPQATKREPHTGGAHALLLTPAARAKPVPTRVRAGHRASAYTDHDDKISLEAAERLRAGARGSKELLRCRCSLLGPPAPCLRRGSSEDGLRIPKGASNVSYLSQTKLAMVIFFHLPRRPSPRRTATSMRRFMLT